MNVAFVSSEPPAGVGKIEVPSAIESEDRLPTVPQIRQFWNPHTARARWNFAVKRCFDVLISSVALFILLPLLITLAVVIRRDSPGPPFFDQMRIGPDNKKFHMYKFRTMYVSSADQPSEKVPTLRTSKVTAGQDPRVTRVGRFIREYGLDELPQFFNVLKGDMSLVGPRPSLAEWDESYEERVDPYGGHLRSGITGLWQISGRVDLDQEDLTRLDLYYLDNWSLMTDMIIVWRTMKLMMQPVSHTPDQ